MQTEINNNSPFLYTDEEKKELRKATLGGGAKGAAIGAKLGSFIPIPGIGTAAGAAIGGLIGGLAGRKKAKAGLEDDPAADSGADYEQLTLDAAANENRLSILEAQQNAPFAMSGVIKPSKKLSAIPMRYAPIKMKNSEAKRAAFMMKISGASSMPEKY